MYNEGIDGRAICISEGPLEMQIALPSMPSLYIISFLYQACLEIHKVGGHILDRIILQNFAWELLQKVCPCYEFTVMMHWTQNRSSLFYINQSQESKS